MEVLFGLADNLGFSEEELIKKREEKKEERGGFNEGFSLRFMREITDLGIDALNIKDIVPASTKVDFRTFSRLLDEERVVASYKMYGLLAILDEVSHGKTEIEFNKLISRMIVYAWYPTMQYRLSFGVFDNLCNISFIFSE